MLDLGSAPGGWSQVAAARGARVVAADVLEMEAIPGVTFFQADLTDAHVPALLIEALGGPADLVMTDMAAPTTGHRATDHLRTSALAEIALEVAQGLPSGPVAPLWPKSFKAAPDKRCWTGSRKAFTASSM